MLLRVGLLLALCAYVSAGPYNRTQVMITMRDSVQLHTIIFSQWPVKPGPIVFIRTPYNATGLEGEGNMWAGLGYNVAMQDFRGRPPSGGQWVLWHDAGTDAYDTMAYLTKQPYSNGIVVATGVSANGIAEYMQIQDPNPWMKGQMVWVATTDVYQSGFPQGAFREGLFYRWLDGIGESSYKAVIAANEAYSPWWTDMNVRGQWSKVTYPIVHLGGWYDIFCNEQLETFGALQQFGGAGNAGENFIIMTPGGHCGGGIVPWPNGQLGFAWAEELAVALFKAVAPATSAEPVTAPRNKWGALADNRTAFYVLGPKGSGVKGNFWVLAPTFPTYTPISLYLADGGKLLEAPSGTMGSDTYTYDPSHPLPTQGGNNLFGSCGPQDWSLLDLRTDVVHFTSAPLPADFALTGPLLAELWVSADAVDTDFVAALTDVYPDGHTSVLLQYGAIRMRWRETNTAPVMMTPGTVYQVNVSMLNTSYIFNKGHSVRFVLSSSNSPHYSVNPNNGLPLTQTGPAVVAHCTVWHGAARASRVILPVVGADALRETSPETILAGIRSIGQNTAPPDELHIAMPHVK